MEQQRRSERGTIYGVGASPVQGHDIEPLPIRSMYPAVRPGTAAAAIEEMDASYRAGKTLRDAAGYALDSIRYTFMIHSEVEALMARLQAGDPGADLLYARLLQKQEEYDRVANRVLRGYGEHNDDTHQVTQFAYREERRRG